MNFLFISHDARRTGGPLLSLKLIEWLLKNDNSINITLLLASGGELENTFHNLTETVIFRNPRAKGIGNKVDRLKNKIKLERFRRRKWNLIFSNTIVNGKVLEILNFRNIPTISYIHEMEFSYREFMRQGRIEGTINNTDFFLCGSNIVKKHLIENFNISDSCTEVVYSFWDKLNQNKKNSNKNLRIRKSLGIPEETLVIGMIGGLFWRKGPDLFVRLAQILKDQDMHFIWVGADNEPELIKYKFEAKMLGCLDKITFIEYSPSYNDFYNVMDVFFLSSREDAYPLVAVEASSYEIPIICFQNAGGIEELLIDYPMLIVPYGDLEAVASAIKNLRKNKLYLKVGKELRKKSIVNHDINKNALLIKNIMLKMATKN